MSDNYSFMKTGLDHPKSNKVSTKTAIDRLGETTEGQRLLGLIAVLMSSAAESASTFAMHAGRASVHAEDVIAALRYEAKRFLHRDDLEQTLDSVMKEVSESEDEVDESSSEEEEQGEQGEDEAYISSKCSCCACSDIRQASDEWGVWKPTDAAEIFLKEAVDKTSKSLPEKVNNNNNNTQV
jgi:Mg-chelatase subunit ChlI